MLIQNRIEASPPVVATGRAASARSGDEAPAVGTRPLVEVRAPRPAAAPEPKPAPTAETVKAAVQQGNHALAALTASLVFEIDADTNITVVKVIDKADNRVLRQFPSAEMLDIARALDRVQGMLVRDEA